MLFDKLSYYDRYKILSVIVLKSFINDIFFLLKNCNFLKLKSRKKLLVTIKSTFKLVHGQPWYEELTVVVS